MNSLQLDKVLNEVDMKNRGDRTFERSQNGRRKSNLLPIFTSVQTPIVRIVRIVYRGESTRHYSFKLTFEIDVTFPIRDTRDNEVRDGRSNARTRLYDPI